jgi:hypothetical protein
MILFKTIYLFLFAAVTLESPDVSLIQSDEHILSGTIIKKEEVWNRRTNPLMGRPDFLIEIIFTVKVDSVITGKIRLNELIKISAKGEQIIVKTKNVPQGQSGIFKFQRKDTSFELLSFEAFPQQVMPDTKDNRDTVKKSIPQKVVTRINADGYLKMNDKEFQNSIETIPGKEMKSSEALQKRTAKCVAKKSGLINAETIVLVSFSGPAPPHGGYIMWGVRGQKAGKWYVWQPGNKWKLIEGKELDDPHRYQK